MTTMHTRALAVGCLLSTLLGCGDALLGADDCVGTDCEKKGMSVAPESVVPQSSVFDVVPQASKLPIRLSEDSAVTLLPGIDGFWSIWTPDDASASESDADGPIITRRHDASGQVVASYETQTGNRVKSSAAPRGAFHVSVNDRLEPVISFEADTMPYRMEVIMPPGEAGHPTALTAPQRAQDLPKHRAYAGIDGTYLVLDEGGGLGFGAVHAFDANGALRWSQAGLVYVGDPGLRKGERWELPHVSLDVDVLSKQSIALLSSPVAGGIGVTTLDEKGNIRWTAQLDAQSDPRASVEMPLHAATRAGELVVAGSKAGELWIQRLAADGASVTKWQGRRAAYQLANPVEIAVDPQGDIYVAVPTGTREKAEATVCRLSGANPEAPVRCVAAEGAVWGADSKLVAPAPGTVMFLQDGHIARLDF